MSQTPRGHYPPSVLDRVERATDDPAALMEIRRLRDQAGTAQREIEAAERERIAALCQATAVERFATHGPSDPRGAAFRDVAAWIREDAAR